MRKQVKKRYRQWNTTHAYFELPTELHEAMKAIQQAREELTKKKVKLCHLYQEAAEQFVNAEPQQRLLNGKGKTAA